MPDGSLDVGTSNGVIHLIGDKDRAFSEIHRMLRPGGTFQLADIVVHRPIGSVARCNEELWSTCIAGADPEATYRSAIHNAGFAAPEVVDRRDYFAASPSERARRIAQSYQAVAIVLRAVKPVGG